MFFASGCVDFDTVRDHLLSFLFLPPIQQQRETPFFQTRMFPDGNKDSFPAGTGTSPPSCFAACIYLGRRPEYWSSPTNKYFFETTEDMLYKAHE
jgi:hypothetical protein